MCKSLAGIKNYNDVCESTGVREYDELSDKGTGTSFWNGYSVGGFNSSGGLGCPLISLARLKIPEMTFSFLSLEVCVCVCLKSLSCNFFFGGVWWAETAHGPIFGACW